MSKKHSLALGCLLLAALAAAYFVVSFHTSRDERRRQEQEAAKAIPFTQCGDISSLSYTFGGTSISFDRDEEGVWHYREDSAFPVLQSSVQIFAGDLGDLTAKRDLGEAADLSVYGLDAPAASFSFTGTDGQNVSIQIGNETENGDYYARKEGDSHIYTIDTTLMNYSGRTLYDWLETDSLPSVFIEDVTEVQVERNPKKPVPGAPEEEITHYIKTGKDEEGNFIWYKDSADQEENRVEDVSVPNHLAASVTGLYIYDCADYMAEPEELARYGLDEPAAIIRYSWKAEDSENMDEGAENSSKDSGNTGDGSVSGSENTGDESDAGSEGGNSVREFSIEIGSLDESGSYYYVRPQGSQAVDRIEKSLVEECLKTESGNTAAE